MPGYLPAGLSQRERSRLAALRRKHVHAMLNGGLTYAQAARQLGVSVGAIARYARGWAGGPQDKRAPKPKARYKPDQRPAIPAPSSF
jgi:transposase